MLTPEPPEPHADSRRDRYARAATHARARATQASRRVSRLAILRLVAFIALATGAIYLFAEGYWPWALALLALGLAGFNQLIRRQEAAQRALAVEESTAAAAEQELALQAYDFSAQDGGADFADPAHPYTGDLDVFGKRSVFAQLNVTASLVGRHALASYLREVLAQAEPIAVRQVAVRELASLLDWRLRFRALGGVEGPGGGGLVALDRLRAWTRTPAEFQEAWWPIVFWGLSLANLAWLVSFAYLPFGVALLGYAPTVVLLYRCKIRVDLIQAQTEEAVAQLQRSAHLLAAIESQDWTSPLLQQLRAGLAGGRDGETSGALVGQLAEDARQLAVRANPFVLMLNVFSLWEIRYARRLEAWKVARQQAGGRGTDFPEAAAFELPVDPSTSQTPHADPAPTPHSSPTALEDWLRSLGAFDALASLAAAADRWPDWIFPELPAGEDVLAKAAGIAGEGMRHPLIPPSRSVPNDFRSPVREHVSLLTGSNMAGKSTLLRTIGLHLVLAQAGSAVPARLLRVTPVRVYTSMRTQDDLHEGASAFYAELQRLRVVVEATRAGAASPVFFLLDEILKGTNSDDRNTGGRALIRQLLQLGGAGVVATHDLGLGDLAQETSALTTLRLEVETDAAGELYFDYTVKPGLAQSRNASALMRRLGLGVEAGGSAETGQP